MRYAITLVFCTPLLLAMSVATAPAQTPVYGYEVVNRYAHDTSAFTEGLVYTGGTLYESTGLYGSSTLRQIDLKTGAVLRSVSVAPQYFAEGMTLFKGKIFLLTWQSQTALVYDPATFATIGQFFYTGEGWGLTHDDQQLIMSDGTNQIRFVDPATFRTTRTISVYDEQGAPLTNINELEYVNGEIYANVWLTNWVIRIDPASGRLLGRINFTGLLPTGTSADVLNGIAYDPVSGHLLVTGKLWPSLFEVRLLTSAASPDGTTVPTASQIVDNNGSVWTVGSGSAILRNGVSVAGGYGSQILWKSGTIYVLGGSTWWQWTGSGWVNVGSSTPGGTTTTSGTTASASPDGTTVPTASQIVDNSGAVWTIASGYLILRNGVSAAGGSGSQILWKSGGIYVWSSSTWWQWTGSGWVNVGSSTPGGTSTTSGTTTSASPDGTTVPTASQIVDNSGAVWTIANGYLILRDGVSAAGGSGSQILWKNASIYVWSSSTWWQWTGSGWKNVGSAQP